MGVHAANSIVSPPCNGGESDDELRALIIQLTLSSVWHHTDNRNIRMLAGLSFSSLINLVNGLNREVCLEILASQQTPPDAVPPFPQPHLQPPVRATIPLVPNP